MTPWGTNHILTTAAAPNLTLASPNTHFPPKLGYPEKTSYKSGAENKNDKPEYLAYQVIRVYKTFQEAPTGQR